MCLLGRESASLGCTLPRDSSGQSPPNEWISEFGDKTLRSGCVARGDLFISNGCRGTGRRKQASAALSTSGARFQSIFMAALRERPSYPISQMWKWRL